MEMKQLNQPESSKLSFRGCKIPFPTKHYKFITLNRRQIQFFKETRTKKKKAAYVKPLAFYYQVELADS